MTISTAVLHVVGLKHAVEDTYPASSIIEIDLSEQGFLELCQFLHSSYAQDDRGEVIPLGPGIYGDSKFYRARGKYYFPKTCNVWTARAIRSAGCPITPSLAITAGNVVSQTKRFGRKIR